MRTPAAWSIQARPRFVSAGLVPSAGLIGLGECRYFRWAGSRSTLVVRRVCGLVTAAWSAGLGAFAGDAKLLRPHSLRRGTARPTATSQMGYAEHVVIAAEIRLMRGLAMSAEAPSREDVEPCRSSRVTASLQPGHGTWSRGRIQPSAP
jgi:hypothetical protein